MGEQLLHMADGENEATIYFLQLLQNVQREGVDGPGAPSGSANGFLNIRRIILITLVRQ